MPLPASTGWVLLVPLSLGNLQAASVLESLRFVTASPDFIEIRPQANLAIDLKYASTGNFMGQDLYGVFDRAFLHRTAADKLARAAAAVDSLRPGCRLVLYDALRPRSIQRLLWERVKGTAQEKYVANPRTGSIHNFGFAVDLSILDSSGTPLDMGTAYDDFSDLAQPRLEAGFLKVGRLDARQVANRKLLRRAMEGAGFIQLPLEWWHFDALPKAEVKSRHAIVE